MESLLAAVASAFPRKKTVWNYRLCGYRVLPAPQNPTPVTAVGACGNSLAASALFDYDPPLAEHASWLQPVPNVPAAVSLQIEQAR